MPSNGGETSLVVLPRYKTKMCDKFATPKGCPYGRECMYAHGEAELRTRQMNVAEGITTRSALRAKIREAKQTTQRGSPRSLEQPSPNAQPCHPLQAPTPHGALPPHALLPLYGFFGLHCPCHCNLGCCASRRCPLHAPAMQCTPTPVPKGTPSRDDDCMSACAAHPPTLLCLPQYDGAVAALRDAAHGPEGMPQLDVASNATSGDAGTLSFMPEDATALRASTSSDAALPVSGHNTPSARVRCRQHDPYAVQYEASPDASALSASVGRGAASFARE